MARPETIDDIEIEWITIAEINVDEIAAYPELIAAYGQLAIANERHGGRAEKSEYGVTVKLLRPPTDAEKQQQLAAAQKRWDEGRQYYETLATVGKTEYKFQRECAEQWARAEGMPFPPKTDPITAIDVVIRDNDLASADRG